MPDSAMAEAFSELEAASDEIGASPGDHLCLSQDQKAHD
jgi:hypothetical protein